MERPKIQAPGLKFRARKDRWVPYWVPRDDAVKAGFKCGTVNLERYLAAPEILVDRCNALQGAMLAWLDGLRRESISFDYTIGSVLRIYQTHEDSPFHSLKPGGRKPYIIYLRRLEREVGDARVDQLTGLDVKRWHRRWSDEGRRPAAGNMCVAVLKTALTFAIVAGHRVCRNLRDDIRELRLPASRPRGLVATADQVIAAREAAHALGRGSAALAYAIQFETALRQWDVAGQWHPLQSVLPSAVIDCSRKWSGLEWRHIGEDLILRYTPSKTQGTSGAEVTIDLRLCPMVIEEIERVPVEKRNGPVIVFERTALPYTQDQFERLWRKVRQAAGLPPKLWSRDLRASAITEGRGGGAVTEDAAKVAGHTKARTTSEVYDRERLEAHRRFAGARLTRRAAKKAP